MKAETVRRIIGFMQVTSWVVVAFSLFAALQVLVIILLAVLAVGTGVWERWTRRGTTKLQRQLNSLVTGERVRLYVKAGRECSQLELSECVVLPDGTFTGLLDGCSHRTVVPYSAIQYIERVGFTRYEKVER